ncbi:hypothetical protein AHAS_Ahas07G0033500 [Arachis hypogaea]
MIKKTYRKPTSYKQKLLEMKIVEVSNFLDILRSASLEDIFLLLLNTYFVLIN